MSRVDGDQAIRLLDIAEWARQQEIWQETCEHRTVMAEEGKLSIHRLDTQQVISICSNQFSIMHGASLSFNFTHLLVSQTAPKSYYKLFSSADANNSALGYTWVQVHWWFPWQQKALRGGGDAGPPSAAT